MEGLLQELRAYGLKDLAFVIVNAKDARSLIMYDELDKRVSFPVYQETEEEQVWSALGGGKDDMYVYDRCGRLTYYIPFPLSIIIEEQPIVKAAVFSTYFQSPCGPTCARNATFLIDLLEEQKTDTSVQEPSVDYIEEEVPSILANETAQSSNDTLLEPTAADYYDAYGDFKWNDNEVQDNGTRNDSYNWNETEHRNSSSEQPNGETLLETVLKYLGWSPHTEEATTKVPIQLLPEEGNTTETPQHLHRHHDGEGASSSEHRRDKKKEVAIRCQGAEQNVCQSWSKKRLLHAQQCCAPPTDSIPKPSEGTCKNYGKRRCKKIKIVLKCCLKTGLDQKEEEEAQTNPDDNGGDM